jgi:hypothetical protein
MELAAVSWLSAWGRVVSLDGHQSHQYSSPIICRNHCKVAACIIGLSVGFRVISSKIPTPIPTPIATNSTAALSGGNNRAISHAKTGEIVGEMTRPINGFSAGKREIAYFSLC